MGKKVYACLVLAVLAPIWAQSTVLFETGFERSEGYDPQYELAGQRGWLREGSGGNGLLEEAFPGMGQQAYIGYASPHEDDFTSVWKPVDFNPASASYPLVRFSVTMQIVQSTLGGDDDFRWSVYNSQADRLFSIDFETSTGLISYVLQDGVFNSTGWTFDFGGTYDLDVWMDFERNSWTALLNEVVLANALPITLSNSPPTLGDVDAVWYVREPGGAGNNYMVFDDYRITAEALSSIPGVLEPLGLNATGNFEFMVHGQIGTRYSIDVTSDFVTWFSLLELDNTDGTFIFEDTETQDYPSGFYRLRELP